MPIYDFKCECGNIQEVLTTNVTQKPELKCEKCGSSNMEKCFPDSMHFKLLGEGWSPDNYQYTYTKTKAGTEEKVKPTYSRKKVEETVKKYVDNTFDSHKHQKI